jgi:hypothetical protein
MRTQKRAKEGHHQMYVNIRLLSDFALDELRCKKNAEGCGDWSITINCNLPL